MMVPVLGDGIHGASNNSTVSRWELWAEQECQAEYEVPPVVTTLGIADK